jgi:16S rRNA (cytidine1402-2'-O)-methyltransferase
VLSSADAVLAEDTRRAGLLLQRLGIESPGFISLHEHNEESRIEKVLGMLGKGQSAALISDAGTPLISDPGYRLVRAAREAGYNVSPVPGPSAATAALSTAGLPPQPHVFLGFLPRRAGERRKLFEDYGRLRATLVFYERKDRLSGSLAEAREILGPREICIARELTKEHEQFILTRLDAFDELEFPLLGEFTVIVGPPGRQERTPEDEVLDLLAREDALGGKPKDVARRVRDATSGWTAKELYEALRTLKKE